METVTFKLKEDILAEIDGLIKPMRYSNRTEFIREAVREKLDRAEKEKAFARIRAGLGSWRKKGHRIPTDEDLRRVREELSKEYLKKWNLD